MAKTHSALGRVVDHVDSFTSLLYNKQRCFT
jgi:hypothetical protein